MGGVFFRSLVLRFLSFFRLILQLNDMIRDISDLYNAEKVEKESLLRDLKVFRCVKKENGT